MEKGNSTMCWILGAVAILGVAAAVTLAVLYSKERKKNADIKAFIDKGGKLPTATAPQTGGTTATK